MFKTLEEANEARLDLVDRIQQIESQLAERAAKVSVGRVPDEEYKAYLEWKARACHAKAMLVSKLGRVKADIQRLRTDTIKQRLSTRGETEELLEELYHLTKSIVSAGVEITPEEQALLDDIQNYLQG